MSQRSALAGEAAGAEGAPISASTRCTRCSLDRERAGPYHPSDRRFLDPFLIDALEGEGLPSDEALEPP